MKVKYTDIEYAFDFINFGSPYEHEAYLNLLTGENLFIFSFW